MFDITRGNLKGNYNKKMFTKSGLVSTGISKLKTNEKKALSDFVLKLMKADDFTVPELKKIAKTKATLLGTSVEEYMKRVEFWKLFRQVKEDSIYGSDETYNAVDIVLNHPITYEEKVKRALDLYVSGLESNLTQYNIDEATGEQTVVETDELKLLKDITKEEYKGYYIYVSGKEKTKIIDVLKSKIK